MKQFYAKVISNQRIAPDHFILSFKTPHAMAKKVKPGQFFKIKVNNSSKPLLGRPFSVHKAGNNKIEILYKIVGEATRILSTKKSGNILDILGPLGNGFDTGLSGPAILVGGGHGVAPLVELAKKFANHNIKPVVFIGARTKKHIVCDKDLRKLGAQVHVVTEDGSKGRKGLVTELLKNKITGKNLKKPVTIYACGPKPMLMAVGKLAKDYKIPCRISLEEYMACGIGTCLGCAVKTRGGYKMVCKDGPVFDAKEIVW
ncbi:MAG: dihydroorotate dehydrogenase electron transfer subunit [Candidatus Omnitrophica bacterium]|nr:dihydroorotate dehydrogenase electron transfer subunit [Candidatus Omnitrophota bacterium]